LIQTLALFPEVGIVGFEPFDRWVFVDSRGVDIPDTELIRCFDSLFGEGDADERNAALTETYARHSTRDLKNPVSAGKSLGLKTRLADRTSQLDLILDCLKRHDVVVFVLHRLDALKWAISKLKGKLQFDVLLGKLSREEIQPIPIDVEDVEECLRYYDGNMQNNRTLIDKLRLHEVEHYEIWYEDFLHHRTDLIGRMLAAIGIDYNSHELEQVLATPIGFRKVHSDDLRGVVLNYDEIVSRFGHRQWIESNFRSMRKAA
jgi:hypothetical protein